MHLQSHEFITTLKNKRGGPGLPLFCMQPWTASFFYAAMACLYCMRLWTAHFVCSPGLPLLYAALDCNFVVCLFPWYGQFPSRLNKIRILDPVLVGFIDILPFKTRIP